MLFEDFTPTRTIWVSNGGSDSNSGSADSPVASINKALSMAQPGTAIMVKAGTYRENVNITKSGTEDAPIALISADGPHAATIVPADMSQRTVRGFGVDNIVLDGFDIQGSNRDAVIFAQAGSNFSNLATNIVIKNNNIHDAGQDGIKIAQAENVHIVNNVVRNTGDQSIDFVAVNKSVISHNDVAVNSGNALIMVKGGSTDVLIHNNVSHDSQSSKTTNGITVGGSTEKPYFRPGFDTYEAKDVHAFDNEIFNVQRGIQFMGAVDSTAHGNHLTNISGWNFDLSASDVWHSPPFNNKGITIYENGVSKSSWLRVASGQDSGFQEYGNVVGEPPNTATPTNTAPEAFDDAVSVSGDTASEGDVLADNGNGADRDADGDPLTVTAVNGKADAVGKAVALAGGGAVTVRADGTFTFDPQGAYDTLKAGEKAVETVSYTISDGNGGTATANLSITVVGTYEDPAPVPGTIVLEAEAFSGLADSGFVVEKNADASGGANIRLPGGTNQSSVSTEVPAGTAPGVYDIVVRYFDESDGVSTSSVAVNGVAVDSWAWDGTQGTVIPDAASASVRVISGVTLKEGDVLTFEGARNVGEWARLDALELVPVAVEEPEPAPTPLALFIEAESFTGLADSRFVVEASADASGGALLRLPSGTNQGSVSTVLPTDLAPGVYDVVVHYFDENDGVTQSSISLDGTELDAWAWDANLADNIASEATAASRTISGISLKGGETLTFQGARDVGEWARIDAIELVPVEVDVQMGLSTLQSSDPIAYEPVPDASDTTPDKESSWDTFLAKLAGHETFTVTLNDGRVMVVSTPVSEYPEASNDDTPLSDTGEIWG